VDRRPPDNLTAVTRRRARGSRAARVRRQMAITAPDVRNPVLRGALGRVGDFRWDDDLVAGTRWQGQAHSIYRQIGQIRSVLNLKANTLTACRWRLKELDDKGEPVDTEDPRAMRAWDNLKGPRGGKRELVRQFALLYDIAAEAFLVGLPTVKDPSAFELRGDSPGLVWEFVSRQELRGDRPTGQRGVVYQDPAGLPTRRPIPPSSVIARWWLKDAQFQELPDSCLRSILPDATEYLSLRDVVTGTIRSRMSAGILLVPESATFGPNDETYTQGAEYEGTIDPLLWDLISSMETAATDRTDPSTYVPLILRAAAGDLKDIRVIPLAPEGSMDWATPLREEKLRMIAQGLSAPPEAMLGKGDISHWGGLIIDDEFTTKWVIPVGEELAEFWTNDYLRPMLRAFEGLTVEEADRFVVEFDPSNITSRADRGVTWLRMFDRHLVTGISTVMANGGTIDDMPADYPQDNEFLWWYVSDLVKRDPSLLAVFADFLGLSALADVDALAEWLLSRNDPGARAPAQLPGDADDGEEITEPGDGDEPTGISGGDPRSGGDAPDTAPDGANALERLVRDLAVAADAAAQRALERAGNRVLNLAGKRNADPTLRLRLRSQPAWKALMHATDDDLAHLGVAPEALLDGAWDGFRARAITWVSGFLASRGVDDTFRARGLVDELCSALQASLLDTRGAVPFDGMLVPSSLIGEIIEAEVGWVHA
jgi:hypothetical protein